ncbi:hypothetical protein [Methylobacterium frigidaeris]|uniref:ASCH domain-containing protein n=1 Tax=Methylobacterium frigidaeris TaxID=2038277 RepID=A0AA37M5K4_9HYPH|nr:hypothetical protein [Methylobacterium frigidaeris]GJD63788.1 hypothetical protein MPEAHAMD_3959 [Methylobacterium frigidaeris]
MTDRPIIFSGPMVRALLADSKTQTRRVLKKQDWPEGVVRLYPHQTEGVPCLPGDRLWVREVVAAGACCDLPPAQWAPSFWRREQGSPANRNGLWYAADGLSPDHPITDRGRWRPSIHMPRWASRLTLAVCEVRVERLHDITEQAASAEGVCHFVEQHSGSASWDGLSSADRTALVRQIYGSSLKAFQHLWETLHGPDSWAANPWVAAISFRVTPANIDTLPEQAGGQA